MIDFPPAFKVVETKIRRITCVVSWKEGDAEQHFPQEGTFPHFINVMIRYVVAASRFQDVLGEFTVILIASIFFIGMKGHIQKVNANCY